MKFVYQELKEYFKATSTNYYYKEKVLIGLFPQGERIWDKKVLDLYNLSNIVILVCEDDKHIIYKHRYGRPRILDNIIEVPELIELHLFIKDKILLANKLYKELPLKNENKVKKVKI